MAPGDTTAHLAQYRAGVLQQVEGWIREEEAPALAEGQATLTLRIVSGACTGHMFPG